MIDKTTAAVQKKLTVITHLMSIFISSFKKASKLKKGMRPQSLNFFFSSWWLKITLFLKKKKLFPLNFADFRLFDGVLVLSVLLHFI